MNRPHPFAHFVQEQGFHTLYLAVPEAGTPVKVGIADDAVKRFASLQSAHFLPLRLHRYWWLPGRAISERVKRAFVEAFAAHCVRGEWFNVALPEAEASVERTIGELGTWGASEAEMIRFMEAQERRKLARMSLP